VGDVGDVQRANSATTATRDRSPQATIGDHLELGAGRDLVQLGDHREPLTAVCSWATWPTSSAASSARSPPPDHRRREPRAAPPRRRPSRDREHGARERHGCASAAWATSSTSTAVERQEREHGA